MCDGPFSMSCRGCRAVWKKSCETNPVSGRGGMCAKFSKQEVESGRDTMDKALLAYCRDNADRKDCACISPPDFVRDKTKSTSEIYGNIGCWYSACRDPGTIKTSSTAHSTQKCTTSCVFGLDDFSPLVANEIPLCHNESFNEQMYRPLSIQLLSQHTAWLTKPFTPNVSLLSMKFEIEEAS